MGTFGKTAAEADGIKHSHPRKAAERRVTAAAESLQGNVRPTHPALEEKARLAACGIAGNALFAWVAEDQNPS